MGDAADRIETLRDRIESSEEMDDDDREALLAFSDELFLRASQYSDHRHEKLLRHCTRMAEEVGGLADALEDIDTIHARIRLLIRCL